MKHINTSITFNTTAGFFRKYIFLMALSLISADIFATDWIVQETGINGASTSITNAITAATDGDRILVYPRGGTAAYVENLTIAKNLTILCAEQGQTFYLVGNITTATAHTFSLTGANVTGNITYTGTTRIWSSYITGSILCTVTNASPHLYFDHNALTGNVTFLAGRVSGCYIYNASIAATVPSINLVSGTSNQSTDTTYITGNTIFDTLYTACGISLANSYSVQFVTNNFITIRNPVSGGWGIHMLKGKTGAVDCLWNNTVIKTGDVIAEITADYTTGNWDIENNIVNADTHAGYAYYLGPLAESLSYSNYNYNQCNNTPVYGFMPNGTNNMGAVNNIDPITGFIYSGPAINGGNPFNTFMDLDLTVNDAGCWGGSFSMANFFFSTSAPRVLFLNAPRAVIAGSTFGFTGDGATR